MAFISLLYARGLPLDCVIALSLVIKHAPLLEAPKVTKPKTAKMKKVHCDFKAILMSKPTKKAAASEKALEEQPEAPPVPPPPPPASDIVIPTVFSQYTLDLRSFIQAQSNTLWIELVYKTLVIYYFNASSMRPIHLTQWYFLIKLQPSCTAFILLKVVTLPGFQLVTSFLWHPEPSLVSIVKEFLILRHLCILLLCLLFNAC